MPEKQLKTAYSKEDFVRLNKTFAYAKIRAKTSKIKNHRDLFNHPWVTTTVPVAPGWRNATELRHVAKPRSLTRHGSPLLGTVYVKAVRETQI